jgi:hypothetical protein
MIDREHDRTLRAMLVGMTREADRNAEDVKLPTAQPSGHEASMSSRRRSTLPGPSQR